MTLAGTVAVSDTATVIAATTVGADTVGFWANTDLVLIRDGASAANLVNPVAAA